MNCYRLDEGSCSNDAKTKLTYIYDFDVLLNRLGYDPIRIDPGLILDWIEQDRTGLSRIVQD